MKPIAYVRPKSMEEALSLLSATARPKGGGFDLLDLGKAGVSQPELLVELRDLNRKGPYQEMEELMDVGREGKRAILVGARMTLAAIARNETIREFLPALSDAAGDAATPLVRNVATAAGSLLQRPRCAYFRDPFFDCRKRGGKTCPAMEGDHAEGAIFGNGWCCAVHPSNLAVALLALQGEVWSEAIQTQGELRCTVMRPMWEGGFFVPLDRESVEEHYLEPKEIVTGLRFRVGEVPTRASAYVEVDQKQSFDWASASSAAALSMEGGKVTAARIALGAVAPVPFISEAASQALVGRVPDEAAATAAAEAAVKDATPLRDNGHKVQHVKVCVKRAILKAAERGR